MHVNACPATQAWLRLRLDDVHIEAKHPAVCWGNVSVSGGTGSLCGKKKRRLKTDDALGQVENETMVCPPRRQNTGRGSAVCTQKARRACEPTRASC